jgi:hypothetical protein
VVKNKITHICKYKTKPENGKLYPVINRVYNVDYIKEAFRYHHPYKRPITLPYNSINFDFRLQNFLIIIKESPKYN